MSRFTGYHGPTCNRLEPRYERILKYCTYLDPFFRTAEGLIVAELSRALVRPGATDYFQEPYWGTVLVKNPHGVPAVYDRYGATNGITIIDELIIALKPLGFGVMEARRTVQFSDAVYAQRLLDLL